MSIATRNLRSGCSLCPLPWVNEHLRIARCAGAALRGLAAAPGAGSRAMLLSMRAAKGSRLAAFRKHAQRKAVRAVALVLLLLFVYEAVVSRPMPASKCEEDLVFPTLHGGPGPLPG